MGSSRTSAAARPARTNVSIGGISSRSAHWRAGDCGRAARNCPREPCRGHDANAVHGNDHALRRRASVNVREVRRGNASVRTRRHWYAHLRIRRAILCGMCEEILYTALVAGLGSLRPFGETSALHAGEVRRMEMKKEQVGDAHVVTVVGRLDGIYGSAFANQVRSE